MILSFKNEQVLYIIKRRITTSYRLLLLLLLSSNYVVIAQQEWRKISEVKNYSNKDVYKSAPRSFDITQGTDGLMYFANEYGLMEFTGQSWKILLQPNNRSNIAELLAADDNNRIYIGSHGEIGYAEKNKYNQIYYVSLLDKMGKDCLNFAHVLGIFDMQEDIYFITLNQLIKYNYKQEKISCTTLTFDIKTVTKINNELYIIDTNNNISKIVNNTILPVHVQREEINYVFEHILPHGRNSLLLITDNNGAFVLEEGKLTKWGQENSILNQASISKGILLPNDVYCFGTDNKGLLFVDSKGKLLQKMDRNDKLLSNTVFGLYLDNTGGLWVSLEGSISYIELNSPFYVLSNDDGVYGATYDAKYHKGNLYLATSGGVYVGKWPQNIAKDEFRFIADSEGQIWDLSVVHDDLFIGGHKGSFVLEGDKIRELSKINGGWNFINIPGRKDIILQGTYSGLVIYEKVEGQWRFRNKIKGFDETCKEIKFDHKGNLWISHGYKGVYQLTLDDEYRSVLRQSFYDDTKGFPSNLFISLLDSFDNTLLFGTQSGVYEYDRNQNKMVLSKEYETLLGTEKLVRKHYVLGANKALFVQGYDRNDDIGMIDYDANGKSTIRRVPFQRLRSRLIPAFEEVISLDKETIGFTSKSGFMIYKENPYSNYKKEFKTLLKGVSIKDSVIYGNVENYETGIRRDSVNKPFPFSKNSIAFSYLSPFYENPSSVKYQTYLEGLDKEWTEWNTEAKKEYNFLPAGEYVFRVRAKNIYDEISDEMVYKFEISPPWYRTIYMYILYGLFVLFCVYMIIKFKNRQKKEGIKKLKMAHVKEMELQRIKFEEKRLKAKNEKIKQDNKKLKQNLESRNKELASSAMQMVQLDNELLQLKASLAKVYENSSGEVKKELKLAIKSLENQIKGDNNWKHFETHFNQIHDNSLDRLRKYYPDLNHRELRLCAYLKLNLSSKEIAPLMGISYRGVESLRFRVRKKMNLDTSINLTDFIIRF